MQGSNGETNKENRLINTEKRGGEGEMYGESNMETYILICKIDSQWEFSVCLKEFREGDGREVQKGGDICTPMADSC